MTRVPNWPCWKSAAVVHSRRVVRLEAMVAEVTSRVDKLKGQIEGAAAEKEQREQENVRLAEQEVQWTAEREAAQQRDSELQQELQAVRTRLAELEEALKTARHELDAARDRRGELVGRAGAVAV